MKWEEYLLKEVADYWTGKVDAKVLDSSNFVSTDNFIPNKGGIVESNYVLKTGKANSYSNNDVLVSNIRPYFKKIWFADKEGGCSNDVLVFRAKEIVEPMYLYYQLSTDAFFDYMVAGSNGTKMPRGNKTSIMEYEISLPPRPTQRRIASILSAYDDLIENNLRRIKLLEEAARCEYKMLMEQDNEIVKLSELFNTSSGGTPSRSKPEYYGGTIPFYKTKELQDGVLIESEEFITEKAVAKSSAKLFSKGTVLLAMYGATIGRVGILTHDATTNQACCAITPKFEEYSNYYIYEYLIENREYVLSFRMGAAQENISQTIIRDFDIPKFTVESMNKFNAKVSNYFVLIENLARQNTQLRHARDLLLPKLMSGEIDVEESSGTTYILDDSFEGSMAAEDEAVYSKQTNNVNY